MTAGKIAKDVAVGGTDPSFPVPCVRQVVVGGRCAGAEDRLVLPLVRQKDILTVRSGRNNFSIHENIA